jgi:hypothetical protein
MSEFKVTVSPKGKKTGAWIIRGTTPPPATNGIEVFHGKKKPANKKRSQKTPAHA